MGFAKYPVGDSDEAHEVDPGCRLMDTTYRIDWDIAFWNYLKGSSSLIG